ncbi:MAG: hypothetical protein LUC93_07005 [Planctomycetaceae bacterium]|nr:hypothetical protein [Planctomycetaceae bacterium]
MQNPEGITKALELLGQLPSLLVNASGSVDACIDDMLSRVGTLLNGSRSFVMLDEKDGKYLRNTHEWLNPSTGAAMFSWPLYDYEYDIPSLKGFLEESDLYFGRTRDMPQDMEYVLKKQGVGSILIAPVRRDGKRIGIAGVTFRDTDYTPQPECRPVVLALAGLVGLALEKKGYGLLRGKLAVIQKCVADVGPYIAETVGDEETPDSRAAKPTTLIDAERRIIIETLEIYNGNKLKTAKHLGLTWPSLDRRCKKLGIEVRRR